MRLYLKCFVPGVLLLTSISNAQSPKNHVRLDVLQQEKTQHQDIQIHITAHTSEVTITANRLTVRDTPQGQALTTLRQGQTVELVETNDHWGKIRYHANQTGWVHLDYTTHASPQHIKVSPTPATKKIHIIAHADSKPESQR